MYQPARARSKRPLVRFVSDWWESTRRRSRLTDLSWRAVNWETTTALSNEATRANIKARCGHVSDSKNTRHATAIMKHPRHELRKTKTALLTASAASTKRRRGASLVRTKAKQIANIAVSIRKGQTLSLTRGRASRCSRKAAAPPAPKTLVTTPSQYQLSESKPARRQYARRPNTATIANTC